MIELVLAVALAGAASGWWLAHRRAARQALAAQQADDDAVAASRRSEHLAAALAGASEGLLVLDADDRVVAANPAAERLVRFVGPCLGRRVGEVVAWPELAEALQQAHDSGEAQACELDAEATGGAPLAVSVRPLPGFGHVIGFDDQSRLRRLESLRRDFVANVSHELKTPLAAIQGFVETMQDDAEMPAATRVRFLDRMARQTERLKTLVGDLLTLSRLDEGPGLSATPCDFAEVVRETVRDLQPLADKKQLRLGTRDLDGDIHVAAEREALRQVAGNLVDNAIKYTPSGGEVTVALERQAGRVALVVHDTGIGLVPEDQARVFERFYRVDRARSREQGGTGLGLSIVKNTVVNLGGEVSVRSELGRGSTFTVVLPTSATPAGDDAD